MMTEPRANVAFRWDEVDEAYYADCGCRVAVVQMPGGDWEKLPLEPCSDHSRYPDEYGSEASA